MTTKKVEMGTEEQAAEIADLLERATEYFGGETAFLVVCANHSDHSPDYKSYIGTRYPMECAEKVVAEAELPEGAAGAIQQEMMLTDIILAYLSLCEGTGRDPMSTFVRLYSQMHDQFVSEAVFSSNPLMVGPGGEA